VHGSHNHHHGHIQDGAPDNETGDAGAPPRAGHNAASNATQWQTPHLPHAHGEHTHDDPRPDHAKDMDLVEAAFCEAFAVASDPTSFLRLAGIPFEALDADGARLVLLRVEQQSTTDLGSVTPHLGGGGFRYAPLPAKLASARNELAFAYFDGSVLRRLTLEDAKALAHAVA